MSKALLVALERFGEKLRLARHPLGATVVLIPRELFAPEAMDEYLRLKERYAAGTILRCRGG